MAQMMIIIDGMADLPGHETDGSMAALHSMPVVGHALTETRPGVAPSSERAIMSLLGYDIADLHVSRSRLEALALSLDLDGNNVFRVNLVDAEGNPAAVTTDQARTIATTLGPQYHAMDRYRMLLTTPSDAPILPEGLALIAGDQRLDPVPAIGRSTRIIAATHLMEGMARHIGAQFVRPAGATGHIDTDIRAKMRAALESYEKGDVDLTLVHIEAADEAAHMRQPKIKADLLAQIDRMMISEFLQRGIRLTVCADHITDAVTGKHHVGAVALRACN